MFSQNKGLLFLPFQHLKLYNYKVRYCNAEWTKKTLQLSVNFSLTPLFITFCASNFVMIWRHAVFVIVKYPMTK